MGREETTWRTESLVKEINHREMFDLNLGDDSNNSNVSSSVVNVEDSNSSSAGHDQNHKTVINFLSLNDKKNEKNNIFVEVDDVSSNNEHEELITRQFFPVNQGPVEAWKAGELRLNLAEDHGLGVAKPSPPPVPVKKSRRGPRSRSSQYRGVTFYRRTGRWESHIWDCGKQVYLGGFDTAHVAARAYDRAAIKFRGVDADINFLVSDYEEDINRMRNLTKDEFVQILRRQSSGSGRGNSKYRGVTMNKCGGWEARMGHFLGKKPCDLAAFRCNGKEAMTNFETRNYPGEITFAVGNRGPSENLDLNLSVSTPSAAMVHKNLRTVQFQPTALELPNFRQRVLTGMHVAEANRLFGGSNQAEKLPNHGAVNSVPVFSSAASSGFSLTASPHVTSLRHLRVPNMFPQNSVVFTLQNHQATFNANRKN